jgi:hypothetical protein
LLVVFSPPRPEKKTRDLCFSSSALLVVSKCAGIKQPNAHLEETLGVLGVELEELTSGTTDLGEGELNAPDLPLVPESVLSGELRRGEAGRTYVSETCLPV